MKPGAPVWWHWPEYLIEAAGLGLFMISASLFGSLLEHPASPIRQALPDPLLRRALMGITMGGTAAAIIYSPWGMRSGAHINPAVTFTFWRLGKIEPVDAALYVLSHFAGAVAGIAAAVLLLGELLRDRAVNYVVTVPGNGGRWPAFAGEAIISFILMTVILHATNSRRLGRMTGLFAAFLVAVYILIEAPISGMSMNPARTFGSALGARTWDGFWIYLVAPPLAMLAAAEVYVRSRGLMQVHCAKLHHMNKKPCIFRCGYGRLS